MQEAVSFFENNYRRINAAGYSPITRPTDSVRVLVKNTGMETFCVLLWDNAHIEIDKERIDSACASIRRFLEEKALPNIRLLNVIYVGDVAYGRNYLSSTEPVWLVDIGTGILVVYNGQPDSFSDVRDLIEAGAHIRKKKPIPYINYILMAINIIVWCIMELNGDTSSTHYLINHGALNVDLVKEDHEIYRMVTSMFMHGGFRHLFNNMFVLWYVGDNLERAVGHYKYLAMYLAGGLLANIAAFAYYDFALLNVCLVGASGAIFSVIGALLYIVIVNKGKLEDLTAPRLIIYIALSVYLGFTSTGTSNSAHIGGLVAGILLGLLVYRKKRGTSL